MSRRVWDAERWASFVIEWQRADSIDQAVKALGMSRGAASTTASMLRRAGVQLKSFRGGPPNLEQLKELVNGKKE